ncbi:MAG: Spy/CpxP family protein refolding chaperone [Hylemonella sp.]|nr:Spy/CpxP family protein refolding chaperone [Hylemonella sp.]
MKYRHFLMTLTALAALSAAVPLAQAQPARSESPREGYGPGMMGGYGGPGQGPYGPGMMRGQGQTYGYGPGMMGGGMMGGGGMIGGMGLGPLQALDLNEQQQTRINQIRDETRRKNWDTMGKLMDEQARLRDLFAAEKRDPAAIGKQSMKMADLRRQMLEASIESHNRIEALLSKEQKDQLRSFRRGWMMGSDD